MAVKVSKKGWVVIPREIRKRHGIRPGDSVQVIDYAGRIAIIPALKDPAREARGMLKAGTSLPQALLTGDPDFREAEGLVAIEWLPQRATG
ncbi:MAG: AbrB/MazE/SpoVT family DNA-binding domain-containing protein [Actinomycetota bacterium]